jgi:hypothetical protein
LREFSTSISPLPLANTTKINNTNKHTNRATARRAKVASPISLDAIELEGIFNTGGAKRAGKKQRRTGNHCM